MNTETLLRIEQKLDLVLSLLGQDAESNTDGTKKTKKVRVKKTEVKKVIIKQGKCNLNVYRDAILITGNTFDRKELIKSLGGRWNSDNKGWTLNINKLDEVKISLEKYFETVNYNEDNAKNNLLREQEDENSCGCDIESDSE